MRALALVLLLVVVFAAPAAAQDDIPDACRTIVGCPDAGPKPENPGDRGGYAQLLTLLVLAGGVGFIATKVGLAVRAGDRRSGSPSD
jgi:hypothetical protein